MADTSSSETHRPNVLLSAAYLMPVRGKAITAHSTRDTVLGLLEETRARRGDGERVMIVDVSATAWNWDTYAIVAGKPSPVSVVFSNEDELREFLPLQADGQTAAEGTLLRQPSGQKVWMPKGARLRESNEQADGTTQLSSRHPWTPMTTGSSTGSRRSWEPAPARVSGEAGVNSMRSMLRFSASTGSCAGTSAGGSGRPCATEQAKRATTAFRE